MSRAAVGGPRGFECGASGPQVIQWFAEGRLHVEGN
jgi:hypothetical protein